MGGAELRLVIIAVELPALNHRSTYFYTGQVLYRGNNKYQKKIVQNAGKKKALLGDFWPISWVLKGSRLKKILSMFYL